jgi:ketosteroid isomerase-like protein
MSGGLFFHWGTTDAKQCLDSSERYVRGGTSLKRIICISLVCTFAVGFMSLRPSPSLAEIEKDNVEAQQAYRDYVEAWKLKDIAALEKAISGDYMAVDFRGKVSDKENEIATAKTDAEWTSMTVEEIHTRIFGKTAIASGFISAQGKTKDGNIFSAKVRFLGILVKQDAVWQLVATQSTSFKPVPAS